MCGSRGGVRSNVSTEMKPWAWGEVCVCVCVREGGQECVVVVMVVVVGREAMGISVWECKGRAGESK